MSADDLLTRLGKYETAWSCGGEAVANLLRDAAAEVRRLRDEVTYQTNHVAALRDEITEVERLRAELARVRPVVDAAVAWAEVWAAGSVGDDERRALLVAVGRLWNETKGTGQ